MGWLLWYLESCFNHFELHRVVFSWFVYFQHDLLYMRAVQFEFGTFNMCVYMCELNDRVMCVESEVYCTVPGRHVVFYTMLHVSWYLTQTAIHLQLLLKSRNQVCTWDRFWLKDDVAMSSVLFLFTNQSSSHENREDENTFHKGNIQFKQFELLCCLELKLSNWEIKSITT